jgi:hypothetical protein
MASNNVIDYKNPQFDPTPMVDVFGFSPFMRTMDPKERVGASRRDTKGREWVYGKATVAITAPVQPDPVAPATYVAPVSVDCGFTAATGAIAAGSSHTAYAGFAIGEHGWVMTK